MKTETIFQTDSGENQIVVYQPNETVRLETRYAHESIWLTQLKIAELFGVQKAAISKHLKNIYSTGELVRESTVSKMETVQNEGGRTVIREHVTATPGSQSFAPRRLSRRFRRQGGGSPCGRVALLRDRILGQRASRPLVGAAFHRRPPSAEAARDCCMHFVTTFLQFTGFRKSVGNGNILGSGRIGKERPDE